MKKLPCVEPEPALLVVIHVIQPNPPPQVVIRNENNANHDNVDPSRIEQAVPDQGESARRYPQRRRAPIRHDDFIYAFLMENSEGDPQSVEEAMSVPDAEEWGKVMNEEMQSLEQHGSS
jgi:hypothetical protein